MKKAIGLRALLVVLVLSLPLGILSCSSSSSSGSGGSSTSSISGAAVKGPIVGATVVAYYFDSTGAQQVLVAQNAPVKTDSQGAFQYILDASQLSQTNGSPLLFKTEGGLMDGQPAPVLESFISDPKTLGVKGGALTSYLSSASTVAAQLLRAWAAENGQMPSKATAQQIAALVEDQLGVDLSENPAIPGTTVALFNEWLDDNLHLGDGANNATVDQIIEYLTANLLTGALDGEMYWEGKKMPVSFAPWPGLSALIPGGPDAFLMLTLWTNKAIILDNGSDAATLTATIRNAAGQYVDGLDVNMNVISGTGTLTYVNPTKTAGGKTVGTLVSDTPGTIVVEATHQLASGDTLAAQIPVRAANLSEEQQQIQQALNAVIMALGEAMASGEGMAKINEIMALFGLEDITGATVLELAQNLHQAIQNNNGLTPCGTPDFSGLPAITWVFEGAPECNGITGTVSFTPSINNGVQWETAFENVSYSECTFNGQTSATMGVQNGKLVVTHQSTDLTACNAKLDGQATMVYGLNQAPLESVAINGSYAYDLDGVPASADLNLLWSPDDGISGDADVTIGGVGPIHCTFENVVLDPDCRLPTQGTMTINGYEVSFEETSCDNPVVTVTLGLLEVQLSVEDALDFFTKVLGLG